MKGVALDYTSYQSVEEGVSLDSTLSNSSEKKKQTSVFFKTTAIFVIVFVLSAIGYGTSRTNLATSGSSTLSEALSPTNLLLDENCPPNRTGCGGDDRGTCNPGYGTTDDGVTCVKCADGTYKETVDNIACTPCDPNATGCEFKSHGICNIGYSSSTTKQVVYNSAGPRYNLNDVDGERTLEKTTLGGVWIKKNKSRVPAAAMKTLPSGDKLFLIEDGRYTKMVNAKTTQANYYVGKIKDFSFNKYAGLSIFTCTACEDKTYKLSKGNEECTACLDDTSECGGNSAGVCSAGHAGHSAEGETTLDGSYTVAYGKNPRKQNGKNAIMKIHDKKAYGYGMNGNGNVIQKNPSGKDCGGYESGVWTEHSGYSMKIIDTHGSGKFECVNQLENGNIEGKHFWKNPPQFYDTVTYTKASNGGCTDCSTDTYKLTPGNGPCTDCDANSLDCGSTSAGTCKKGFTSLDKGVTCAACSTGMYKVTVGNEPCTACDHKSKGCGGVSPGDCAKGYTSSDGGVTCDACKENSYKLAEGNGQCAECDENSLNCASTHAGECKKGYSSSNEGVECSACTDSTYKTSGGNTACTACDENSVDCGGTSPGTCVAGYTLGASTATCDPCPVNTYKLEKGNERCTSCSANMMNCGGSSEGVCSPGYAGTPIETEEEMSLDGSYTVAYGKNPRKQNGKNAIMKIHDKKAWGYGMQGEGNVIQNNPSPSDCAGYESGVWTESTITTVDNIESYSFSSRTFKPGQTASNVPKNKDGLINVKEKGEWLTFQNGRWESGNYNKVYWTMAGSKGVYPPSGTWKSVVASNPSNTLPRDGKRVYKLSGYSMKIIDTHGSGKFECVNQLENGDIEGKHFWKNPPQFYGTVTYTKTDKKDDDVTANKCTACADNTYKASGGNEECSACDENRLGCGTHNAGICKKGYTVKDSSDKCITCNTGSYKHTNGDEDCKPCLAHSVDCGGDQHGVCSVGYGGHADEKCTECPVDTYKTSKGNEACNACDKNSDKCISTSAGKCVAGFGGDANGNKCVACKDGTYKSSVGNFECTACAENSTDCGGSSMGTCSAGYTLGAASAGAEPSTSPATDTVSASMSCNKCIAGTYKSTKGLDVCDKCEEGKFSTTVGASDVKTCDACPSGFPDSHIGSSKKEDCKTNCPAGFVSHDEGKTCTACPKDTYKLAEGNKAFSADKACEFTCDKNSNKCGPDTAGICKAGYESAKVGDGSKCTPCKAGWFKEKEGNVKCDRCQGEYTGDGSEGATSDQSVKR